MILALTPAASAGGSRPDRCAHLITAIGSSKNMADRRLRRCPDVNEQGAAAAAALVTIVRGRRRRLDGDMHFAPVPPLLATCPSSSVPSARYAVHGNPGASWAPPYCVCMNTPVRTFGSPFFIIRAAVPFLSFVRLSACDVVFDCFNCGSTRLCAGQSDAAEVGRTTPSGLDSEHLLEVSAARAQRPSIIITKHRSAEGRPGTRCDTNPLAYMWTTSDSGSQTMRRCLLPKCSVRTHHTLPSQQTHKLPPLKLAPPASALLPWTAGPSTPQTATPKTWSPSRSRA